MYSVVLISAVQQSDSVIYVYVLFVYLFKIYFIYLFIYFWLRWVFMAVPGLLIAVASLVAEHGL